MYSACNVHIDLSKQCSLYCIVSSQFLPIDNFYLLTGDWSTSQEANWHAKPLAKLHAVNALLLRMLCHLAAKTVFWDVGADGDWHFVGRAHDTVHGEDGGR